MKNTIVQVLCDVCKEDKETKPYVLVSLGRRKEVDLCDEDAKPFEVLLDGIKPRGGARRPARGRAPQVLTEEEIEQKKQEQQQRQAVA